jgi:hypothetical protein
MKRTWGFGLGLVAMAGLLATAAAAQSLGEYARQQRAQKPPTPATVRVYTNDNLPGSGSVSEAGQSAASSSAASAKAAEKGEQQKDEDRSKLEAEWRKRFAEQKDHIAMLERELKLPRVENNMKLTALYSGLYDPKVAQNPAHTVAEEDTKYKSELEEKKKALEEAKQKLEDMKDELRRAGLPASWAD